MSATKDVFYDLFWQSKACQNLFLLSKEELLDSVKLDVLGVSKQISFPRIIISNIESKEHENFEAIKFRTESSDIRTGENLDSKLKLYEPLIGNFLDSKFGKSFEKLMTEYKSDKDAFFEKILFLVFSEEPTKNVIEFLQQYGFVGKHIKSVEDFEKYFEKEGLQKITQSILTEENFRNLLEFARGLKDLYANQIFKGLYESNQVLVNSLHSTDNFESRLKLFGILYESKIISASKDDAYLECTHCDVETYRGVMQLTVNPKRLSALKCPFCSTELSYYVPYELHEDIYLQVKRTDGIIQSALENLLERNDVKYEHSKKYLKNIEVDCLFEHESKQYIIECKMYVSKVGLHKLKTKVKGHYGKLQKDVLRLLDAGILRKNAVPILLVNIASEQLISELQKELEETNSRSALPVIQIMSIQSFKELF